MKLRDVMIAGSRRDGNALIDRESSGQLRVAAFTIGGVEDCPLHRIVTQKRVEVSHQLTYLYPQPRGSSHQPLLLLF